MKHVVAKSAAIPVWVTTSDHHEIIQPWMISPSDCVSPYHSLAQGCRVLIPGVDLLNHGGLSSHGGLGLGRSAWGGADGDDGASIFFVTDKVICLSYLLQEFRIMIKHENFIMNFPPPLWQAVPAGDQVLWSYGQRCSDDLFVYHGFCLDGNVDEDIALFRDVDHLMLWAGLELQGMGLEVPGMNMNLSIVGE